MCKTNPNILDKKHWDYANYDSIFYVPRFRKLMDVDQKVGNSRMKNGHAFTIDSGITEKSIARRSIFAIIIVG